jgi:DNA adenine methylase
MKGKFILSLNDVPGVRDTFANFKIEKVPTRYTISATPTRRWARC